MDSDIRVAIEKYRVIDLSAHGRKSGASRRIEIRPGHADGRIFFKRSWYSNLSANAS